VLAVAVAVWHLYSVMVGMVALTLLTVGTAHQAEEQEARQALREEMVF
jgi:Tfp pilus assembly protein PilX